MINVHLKSLRTNNNFKSEEDVRLKRMAQAQALKVWLQKFIENNKKTKLMVLGDFNATKSGVGGVDVLKEIMSVGLFNSLNLLPEDQQYTYVYKCQKEDLDHILLSASLQNSIAQVAIGRGNANSPYRYKKKVATPMKSSDHDGIVLYLR